MTERAPLPIEWRELRQRLQGRVFDLLPALGIHAREVAGKVTPLNPTRSDGHPGSFVIWTRGDRAGAWVDFATDEKGDVIDLIVYVRGLAARIDAYWWALEFLGLGRGEVRRAPAGEEARRRAERERLAAKAREEASEAEKARKLSKRWFDMAPLAGSLAEVYLRQARGIDLDRLPRPPGALRFVSELQHVDQDTGEVSAWPAMVAAMVKGREISSLHRTWLAPDGLAKAPVTQPKMMLGPARGAVIHLARGPTGVAPNHAKAIENPGPLAIGEGIETCLTVAAARPDLRVWSAGSLSNMANVAWPACASAVVLLGDNDASPTATKAFAAVEALWRKAAQGRPLHVARSGVGSDFNDRVKAA